MDIPLRERRLRRPRLAGLVIDRTSLFDRPPVPVLEADPEADATEAVVTLVSAPPGAGKTTLLSRFAKKCAERGGTVAWVTFDRADNDRALFWTALFAALHTAVSGSPHGGVAAVRRALSSSQWPPLAELDRLVASAPPPVWLFLDDLHELRSADVLADLDALLAEVPDDLELVLASRRDPAVGLHRLRLDGRLREIRAGDLALDREEVRRILAHHGVTLSGSELTTLVDRTEGWAAGVRLAALTLAAAPDRHEAVRQFAGDDRAVADYLATEVLASLGERERHLLRLCAVPEHLSRDLAVAITGEPSADALLENLYRENVLVVRLGRPGGWYRIHPLLRGYLLAEMERVDRPALRTAHRRAASWLARHGEFGGAIDHAIASGDDGLAVEHVTAHGPRLLADGRARILCNLIRGATAAVRSDPAVRRLETLALLEVEDSSPVPGPRPPVHDHLTRVAVSATPREEPLEALVDLHRARHDLGASAAALESTAAGPADREDDLGLLVVLNRGIVLLMAGRLDEADGELSRASALAERTGNAYAALRAGAYRTALVMARGQFRQARGLANETIRRGLEVGSLGTAELAGTLLLAAHSERQQLDGAAARRLAEQSAALEEGIGDLDTALSLRTLLALLDVEEGGDPLDGCRRLRTVWEAAGGRSLSVPLVLHLAFNEHRCAWLAGRLDWAREALARVEYLRPAGDVEVLAATEHLARGRFDAARHRLAPVLDGATPCLMPPALQQGWLIEALVAAESGQTVRSHEALRTALEMGAESGALRAFLDVPGIDALLDENAARFGRLDPLAERIRAAGHGRADHAVVPMTPKELAVLTDLPAQLTLEEIAARQQVSVNTVKTHVRSIYQKLGASSRRDAVATARRRGLL